MAEDDGMEGGPQPDDSAQADAAADADRPRKRKSGWDDAGDGSQAAMPPSVSVAPPGEGVNLLEFKVEQSLVGFLIGKGGESLKSMEASSTATIKIDQGTKDQGFSMVTISGNQYAVATAKALIDGRIQERQAGRTAQKDGDQSLATYRRPPDGAIGWETNIEQNSVGFFIGKGGEYIKRIQAQTGCTVFIDQDTKEHGYSMVRIVDGPGLREASEMVRNRLEQVREATVQKAPPGEYEEISVEQFKVGAIIGRGGETLKQIKAESGATVVLSQESKGQGYSVVRFAGSPESIEYAKQMIQQRLAEREAGKGDWVGAGKGGWGDQGQGGGKGGYAGINPPPPPPPKGSGKGHGGDGGGWGSGGGCNEGGCASACNGNAGCAPPPPPASDFAMEALRLLQSGATNLKVTPDSAQAPAQQMQQPTQQHTDLQQQQMQQQQMQQQQMQQQQLQQQQLQQQQLQQQQLQQQQLQQQQLQQQQLQQQQMEMQQQQQMQQQQMQLQMQQQMQLQQVPMAQGFVMAGYPAF